MRKDMNYNDKLDKFTCCVYNVTNEQVEYINGNHPLIEDYIIASSALWIVYPPRTIKKFKFECSCDKNCICYSTKKSNLFEYCDCNEKNHRENEYIDGGILKPLPLIYDDNFEGSYLLLSTKNIDDIKKRKLSNT